MKKLLLLLLFLSLTINAHAVISPDNYLISSDLTLAKLSQNQSIIVNEINSLPGGNIQNLSITHGKLDANSDPVNRWNEAFNDFVYTGLLPPTSASLSSTTTLGTAYIDGMRVVKDATAKTYTASKDTFVDLSSSGVYTYSEVAIGATEPATTANSIRLAKVRTSGTAVTTVTDKRDLDISLAIEDFYIKGLELIVASGDATTVTADAGICYIGDTRIKKIIRTRLELATAADWWDGVVDSYDGDWCYIGIDTDGNIKFLGNNPPNKVDTDGNTIGTYRYWYDSSVPEYWRVIGAVSVDASNNLGHYFIQIKDWVMYYAVNANPKLRVLKTGNATSYTDVPCTNAVPAFTKICNVDMLYSGGGSQIDIRPNGIITTPGRRFYTDTGAESANATNVLLDSSQKFEYKVNSNAVSMYISGYYIGDLR